MVTKMLKHCYISRVILFLVCVVVFSVSSGTHCLAQNPPNILFIMADDLGWTDLGKFSQHNANHPLAGTEYDGHLSSFYETPNISRLAESGVVFTSAYATPICATTRANVMSGQSGARTHLTQVNDTGQPWDRVMPSQWVTELAGNVTTIGEVMQEAGYATALIGKWHIGHTNTATGPRAQGFDVNIGGTRGGAPNNYFANSNGQYQNSGGGSTFFFPRIVDDDTTDELLTADPGDYLTDVETDEAIDFISQNSAGPFYLQLWYETPHDTSGNFQLQAPAADIAPFVGKPSDGCHSVDNYAGMIFNMDRNIGRILDFLEDTDDPNSTTGAKLIDNTIVIFYSDNGGDDITPSPTTCNEPLSGIKRNFLEGGMRVPLIVRVPGMDSNGLAGTLSDELIRDYDFLPTFADLANEAVSGLELDGVSFANLISGPNPDSTLEREAIFHHTLQKRNGLQEPFSGLTSDRFDRRYKLIHIYETNQYELYDLTNDISETTNLLAGIDLTSLTEDEFNQLAVEDQQLVTEAAELVRELREWLMKTITNANVPYLRDSSNPNNPQLDENDDPVRAFPELSCFLNGEEGCSALIGHWTFDNADTVGNQAIDVTGRGADGTIGANVTTGVAGIVGEAYSFNDTTNAADAVLVSTVNAVSVANAINSQVSISAWISSTDTSNGRNTAVSLVNSTATNNYIDLGIVGDGQGSPDGIANARTRVGGNNDEIFSGTTPVNDGMFHHLVLTLNRSGADEISLYIDGELINTGAANAFPNIDRIDIGRLGRAQGPASPYSGLIDDVQIYSRVLSAADVEFLFNNPGRTIGSVLLGDLNLDGVITGADIQPFIWVLLTGNFQPEADMNQDGVITGADIQPFIVVLLGG